MDRSELIEKLQSIDENMHFSNILEPGKRASVIIVGASALLLHNLSHKGTTKDVDIYEVEQSIQEVLFSDHDFNSRCNAYSQCLPYNFEDRLKKIDIESYVLDVFVPSIEDLTVMKLYRWSDIDIADLTDSELLDTLDWELLNHLVHSPNEAEASRITTPENDPELHAMRQNYAEYETGHRK